MNFAFSNNGCVVATGINEGVWISDNTGGKWVKSSLVIDPSDCLNDVVVNNSNYIFVASNIAGLYISKNFGASWDKKMINPIYHDVYRLFLNNNGSLFASAFADYSTDMGCKVFRSDDNGASWTVASNGLTNDQVLSFAANSDGSIYLGSMGSGVYRSLDNGQTWIPFNNGLKRKYISSVYIDRNGYLYAGSSGGDNRKKSAVKAYEMSVDLNDNQFKKGNMTDEIKGGYLFRMNTGVGTAGKISKPESENVTLAQNYPNPFSGETEIRFTLPETMHVQLILFNSTGVLVKTLIDAEAPAGLNTVRFKTGNLKSGIYFYQLNTAAYTQMKNMIIIK